MKVLAKNEILDLLKSDSDESLFIDPLIDINQVKNISIDLRLGCDFLVSILTRKPVVELHPSDSSGAHRPVRSFFQETRRDLGQRFVVYPGQTVLATTLEYISLPSNVFADLVPRSSYSRLGLSFSSMIQPGYRGCLPLELFNHGNNPVELLVGSRICQIRMFEIDSTSNYLTESAARKYLCSVRPTVSSADADSELGWLNALNQ